MTFKKSKTSKRKIFSLKIFILAGFLASIFISIGYFKELYRGYQIQKEIDSLKKDISSIENSNYKLSQLIEYYKTEEYKEVEARRRLNMKKEGESMVIIKPNPAAAEEQIKEDENVDNGQNLPNYIKWWNYFFASK